ncbi:MAG TPA: signal peptidase II [Virgibacillus sp.]|nr:signal peptidase II [Virgibacillus sp.]
MGWYYLLSLIIIGIDQFSKWLIVKNMEFGDRITVIDNFFHITSHRNSGAAWGILEGKMGFFYVITIIVVIGLIYYMQKYGRESSFLALSLSFVLAGAIGNFIDRVVRKEVVDFLDFNIFTYNYPIFNIADSVLVVGVILLLIATIINDRKEKKNHE